MRNHELRRVTYRQEKITFHEHLSEVFRVAGVLHVECGYQGDEAFVRAATSVPRCRTAHLFHVPGLRG